MKFTSVDSVRRLCCAGAAALALAPAAVMAQAYPAKQPVKIIVNNPAGGPTDILARATAEALQKTLKQAFIVDNRTGAGGNVGADVLAKSSADGYTLMISFDTTLTVNPHIYKGLPFQPSDLRPVFVLASSGLLVGSAASTGITSFQGLVDTMRRKPLNFASGGNGSPGHLAIEVFRETGKFNVQHVPYRGNNPAVTAIVAGEVDAGVLATPGMLPHVKSGKINALAVTSRQRSRLAPEVPTVAEAGFKDLQLEVLYVVFVPRQTPEPVVRALETALREILQQPEFQARLASLDFAAEGLTGQAARQRLDDQSARYARIAAASGMRPE